MIMHTNVQCSAKKALGCTFFLRYIVLQLSVLSSVENTMLIPNAHCTWHRMLSMLVCLFFGAHCTLMWAQDLEKIAPKCASTLASTVLYFGENVQFSADIASEAHFPANELVLSYKFSGDERVEVPYQAMFRGELIPGYARKVEVEISRKQPNSTTASKQLLWAHTYEVQQTPPTFDVSKVSMEVTTPKGKAAKIGECAFAIKGLRVDFAKPVDADKNRVILALVNDLEISEPQIDTAKTQLQFFTADKREESLSNALRLTSMSLSGFFDAGVFLVNIGMKNLPKLPLKGKALRGTLGIKLSVKLLNRRAMRSATAEETILIPISLTF